MKHWLLFALLFVATFCILAKRTSDEEFLAKAVIGNIQDTDSTYYISPRTWYPYIPHSEWESDASKIRGALRELGVPDSNIVQITDSAIEIYEKERKKRKQNWNKKSKLFKSEQKRQVHFEEKKDKLCLHVSKPIFDLYHDYAVVEIKEITGKRKFKRYFSLYKKEDDGWIKKGDFARFEKNNENETSIYFFSDTEKSK